MNNDVIAIMTSEKGRSSVDNTMEPDRCFFVHSHRWPAGYWKEASEGEWTAEFSEQKTMISTFSHLDDVRGMRAPYMQMGGDR